MTKSDVIILGAGAIGRGYLPWVLDHDAHRFVFVDSDPTVVKRMREAKKFIGYRVRSNAWQSHTVEVAAAYLPDEFDLSRHPDAIACFACVGPRNIAKAAGLLHGTNIPLILCENDPATVATARAAAGYDDVGFAVPDVITSNSAPEELRTVDPLTVITEDGKLFMEQSVAGLKGDFTVLSHDELLYKQWTAKLYVHNTPHCIAAYLGALVGATYVHEAMSIPEVDARVAGAMEEMNTVLKMRWEIPHDFLDWYAAKELSRFRCQLLFDPVLRVAREPLRKLELEGRLVGAAEICLSFGMRPHNILLGIAAALLYEDRRDPDLHLSFLRRTLSQRDLNEYVLGLRPGEALDLILREHFDTLVQELSTIPRLAEAS